MSAIILPQLVSARFTGFEPLFAKPVELSIPPNPGPFLIIGGNGLGKTTMLQSIMFAVAGGADKDAFSDAGQLWNQKYFSKRLTKPKDAEVRVIMMLGQTKIEVRRGLDNPKVRGVRINDAEPVNSTNAEALYEATVVKASNCNSFRDFKFLMHRLCYLPEDRHSLVWDVEGQLGVSLLVCGESADDEIIRGHIQRWRKADTEMRHTHVSVTHLEERLAKALSAQKKQPAKPPKEQAEETKKQFEKAKAQLTHTTEAIVELTSKMNRAVVQLQEISAVIEAEEQNLDEHEEAFTLSCMLDQERADSALALQKMLIHKQCPFCTKKSTELTSRAASNLDKGLCPICGQHHTTEQPDRQITDLRKQLAPKYRKRAALQETLDHYQHQIRALQRQRNLQGAKLDDLSVKLPRIRATDTELDTGTESISQIRKLLAAYTADYERKQTATQLLKSELDFAYSRIAASKFARFSEIQDRVAIYATKFLGIKCTFESVPSKAVDKNSPFAFPLLVPSFKGIRRTQSTQCSESQAFFLDIAFRMALIDLVEKHSGYGSTFICETPENALDLAYADNVAEMFNQFRAAGCYALLTANLQAGGVAEPLLKKIKPLGERKLRAFNMLSHAELSGVQKRKRPDLDTQFNKLIS
ncbi:AAA domain-containing protein [Prosthecobacter debontii]|uniref:AAA domain-containing protein n=1 Tax=Prosthecobacter debontii TaxID=48467 RepID=A0A1T4XFY6_9BACT|nr:ATP-binding protein [Prosthecobacter debontii]SKA88446.1 AAA domain-containing protein [Prosthecobacter debontii]